MEHPDEPEGAVARMRRGLKQKLELACVLLALAGLSAIALTVPGPWTQLALADDDGGGDDGGGGDDDDDDDGGVGNAKGDSTKRSERADRARRAEARKKAPVRKRRPPPLPPTLVVTDLPETALREARRRGFTILNDERLETIGVRVQRLRPPPRMAVRTARRILQDLGASSSDLNMFYRPQEESCGKDGCKPEDLIGWTEGRATGCFADPLIGLVETTVDLRHTAVAGQSIEVIDMRPKGRKKSGSAHGTAVAAIIAGADGGSSAGLLPKARVVATVPYYRSSRGGDVAEVYDVIRAIDVLVKRQPHVINLSLAGPDNAVLKRAIEQAVSLGVPVVAAAGNAGSGAKPLYPAAYEQAVAVTAVSPSLRIYRRAPRGEHIDFAAPGVLVEVAAGKARIEKRSGTSYAAPYVAAALAVMRQHDPASPVADIVARLAASARDLGEPGRDKTFGWGLLQASDLCRPKS